MANINPEWVNEEWCSSTIDANCTTFAKITTVNGGMDQDKTQWLDLQCTDANENNCKFIWSENPAKSWFLTPYSGARLDKYGLVCPNDQPYMFFWDETQDYDPADKTDPNLISNITRPIVWPGTPSCLNTDGSNKYSNTTKCATGHGVNFKYGTTGPSDDMWWNKQTWGTGPVSTQRNCHWECNGSSSSSVISKCDDDNPKGDFTNCRNYWMRATSTTSNNNRGVICNWSTPGRYKKNISPNCKPSNYIFAGKFRDGDGSIGPNIAVNWSTSNPPDQNSYPNGCQNYGPSSQTGSCVVDDLFDKCSGNPYRGSINDASWITENAAASCCALPVSDVDNHRQCGTGHDGRGAFNACSAGTKCTSFMPTYCENEWPKCAHNSNNCLSGPGLLCNNFIRGGGECPFSGTSTSAQTTSRSQISNYVNSDSRCSTEGTADCYPDYVSWILRNKGNKTSLDYYNHYGCTTDPANVLNGPCSRDDSTDPFFTEQMYYYCNSPVTGKCSAAPGSPKGNCDDILQYMCQQFDRDDIGNDYTLAKMCGCYLLTNPDNPPGKPEFSWKTQHGQPQSQTPYYQNIPDGQHCDPMCMTANANLNAIIPCGGLCVSSTCLMDDITLNAYNSSGGDIKLLQACGNCDDGGGNCSCYMTDITINSLNSTYGDVELSQTCGTCYYYDNDGNPYPVDCETGEPLNGDDGEKEGKKEDKPWWKRQLTVILGVVVILAIVLFLGYWYYSYHKWQAQNLDVSEAVTTFDDYYYY